MARRNSAAVALGRRPKAAPERVAWKIYDWINCVQKGMTLEQAAVALHTTTGVLRSFRYQLRRVRGISLPPMKKALAGGAAHKRHAPQAATRKVAVVMGAHVDFVSA